MRSIYFFSFYLTQADLAKFFDTVDHDKLMTIFGRTIKDGDVISVVRKFLASGVMIDDEYEDTIVGTPQGGNISPLLANIMLNELDKELEARGLNFVRYADDLIIMVGSRQAADRVMKSVTRFIEEKLGLKVNAEKSRVDKPKGIKYLGFGFYFDSFAKAYKARPHPKAVAKFKAQMQPLTAAVSTACPASACPEEIAAVARLTNSGQARARASSAKTSGCFTSCARVSSFRWRCPCRQGA